MEFDFLSPVDEGTLEFVNSLSTQHLGRKVQFHTKEEFPELEPICIAIIGVLENRGDRNASQKVELGAIRRELYGLYPGNWLFPIADLGDILGGDSVNDTYYAVKGAIAGLVKRKIIPIVIGGSQDLTYPMYRAYDKLEQMVNLVAIDNRFDFGKDEVNFDSNSFLSRIVVEEPNNLFNYSNIGYQTYYNSQEEIDLLDKLYFDAYRLGDISANIALAEPVLRDADVVSVDLTSVKSADSGNFSTFMPNGFSGKEICALARYAGISDRVSAFGLFEQNGSAQEAVLIGQIIWYFIEGFHYRSNEYPFTAKDNYTKYIVPYDNEELIFYKSDKTDRWWIEIPFFSTVNNKLKRNTLLPCSHEEYLAACNQEIPERWWKAQRKSCV